MSGRVLVAGGTGRLGTLVVTALAERGVPVRVLTRDRRNSAHLPTTNVETVVGDVREPATLAPAVAGVDVVVSAVQGFAGPGGVTPASVDRDGNVHLIGAARSAGADMVLMSVVGAAPDHPMELFRMKAAAEKALTAAGLPATVVRATAFAEVWIDVLLGTAGRSRRPLIFGRGQNPINFVAVGDVAALVDRVTTDRTYRGRTLEIGGPDNLTLDQLARAVAASHGLSGEPRHVPPAVLRAAAATVGRIRPSLGRQISAALVMDDVDMTFDDQELRREFPNLPRTPVTPDLK